MALDPESLLGTPAGYASPQQLEMARQLAAALIKPKPGMMQSWTQPASQIVNALLGAKMMQQAGASERSMAGAGLPLGSGSPLSQPGQMGPRPQGDLGGGLTRIATPSGVPFTVSSEHADKFQGFFNDLEAAGYKINPDPSGGGYNPRNIAGTNTPSQHSYGMAVDINPSRNQTGTAGDIPPDLARALAQKHGLTWGGDFKHATPDPMHFEVSRNAPTAQGGSVQSDASGSPAGAQTQPPVSTSGQGPQPTPAPSASPQMTPGSQPPPELFRRQLITPQDVYAARMRGDPHAFDLYKMYLEQQQPQHAEFGGVEYVAPPGHPEQAVPLPGKPERQNYKVGQIEGGDYKRLTAQGYENVPQVSGAGGTPTPQTAGAPPSASGGYPSQMPSDLGGRIQLIQQMERQKNQSEADVKQYSGKFGALVGLGQDAQDQLPYIQIGKSILNDPGFYSGTSESSVLALKRLAVAAGLTAPAGATPQEAFRKVMATMILNQVRTMKEQQAAEGGGTQGRIFQMQAQLMEKAAANPDNSPAANRYLLNLFEWASNRNLAIANMALDYKKEHGALDPGFDKILLNSKDERLQAPESLLFSPTEGGAEAAKGPEQAQAPLQSKAGLGGPTPPKFEEGRTATNPTTGERMIFKGGKWQKM